MAVEPAPTTKEEWDKLYSEGYDVPPPTKSSDSTKEPEVGGGGRRRVPIEVMEADRREREPAGPSREAIAAANKILRGEVVDGVYIPPERGVKGDVYHPYTLKEKSIIERGIQAAQLELYSFTDKGVVDVVTARASGVSTQTLMVAGIGSDTIRAADKHIIESDEEIEPPRSPKDKFLTSPLLTKQQKETIQEQLQTTEIIRSIQKATPKEKAKLVGELALDLLPIIGTYRFYQQAKKDGWTPAEISLMALSVAVDIAILTGLGAAVGTAARGAVGLSRTARIVSASKAAAGYNLALIKAPYTMVRHPVDTAKGLAQLVETVVRPSKIPLAATEVSYSTIRLPVKAFAAGEQAMNVRDVATLAAIQEAKFTTKIGNATVKLDAAAIQRVGQPVAVHTTPDVRPFLEGATITAGREGGLFVAPNLHTRFSVAAAFGDVPEGGIRGALIIRDKALLNSLGGSGKIYRSTAEIEVLLKSGIDLPKPSQVLITRAPAADAAPLLKEAKKLRALGKLKEAADLEAKAAMLQKQGSKLTLLVYGEPYSAAEIANLKIMGSLSNIRSIYTPSATLKVGGVTFDDLNAARRSANELLQEAGKLRRAGKLQQARLIEGQADEAIERATRLAMRLSAPRAEGLGGVLRVAFTTSGRSTLERYSDLTAATGRRAPRSKAKEARRLPDLNMRRVDLGRVASARVRLPIPTRGATGRAPGRVAERGRVARESEGRRVTPLSESRRRIVTESRGRIPPPLRGDVPSRGRRTTPLLPPPRSLLERRLRLPRSGSSDKEKRRFIRKKGGAVTWNMGKLRGKDVWHTRVPPYTNADHIVVLGKKPVGAIAADGPGSAYKTAQLLSGKPPAGDFTQIHGAVTARITPEDGDIGISFRPTTISKRPIKLPGRGNSPRITPKRPRLGR